MQEERYLYDPKKTAEEAEKDIRALCEDTLAQKDSVEVDMSLAIVPGFKDGIKLLPHQILGRTWMTEREQGKSRGGILADDMGLGKTIQTLARIVEGRPTKVDKKDGWAAPTLVVCPLALVAQWKSEAAKITEGLRVIEHHGPKRTTDPEDLKRAHLVVTTYQIVEKEYQAYQNDPKNAAPASDDEESDDFGNTLLKKKPKTRPKKAAEVRSALFKVKWWRVVLDEAHNIKNRKTKMAIACHNLPGKFRWCLTGTPLQNSVEELYSLLKFLEIRPLNDWDTFNSRIAKPVKSGRSGQPMKRLHLVLNAVMLRRKKDTLLNGKPLLELPARNVEVVACNFDAEEREFYNAVEEKVRSSFEKLAQAGNLQKSYTTILVLLLRLRQACDHPALINKDYRADAEAIEPKAVKNGGDNDDDDELANAFGALGVSNKPKCQMCRTELDSSNTSDEDGAYCTACSDLARRARRKSTLSGPSSLPPDSAKIRKIVELLHEIDERSEGQEKTIIFSQFTSMLDLIEPFLKAQNFQFVRYDGSMAKDKRDAALEKLKTDKNISIILISFKAGSTGLNLTSCNNVIMTDLWWNPALEDQAFDRAHRFGQKRDVFIYKLTIESTVEQRILELQEKKRALANAALAGDKLKSSKLGLDDLVALFHSADVDDADDYGSE
ncbi:hypothetical protein NEOLEDRAFT_1157534 [Neolentinus lepideus HHB14362 ss-1]|uniref:Uncharacterized protein n=1 Tax=Neolentinus lepideus HHB14362 ss-1 TaxID=1314782 RepID=A0A165QVR3_9AGAM|nr:hypothetical protein NEOLEDRAFT_1157534 [Neolentinus lepideus HHB14362 ss-1]